MEGEVMGFPITVNPDRSTSEHKELEATCSFDPKKTSQSLKCWAENLGTKLLSDFALEGEGFEDRSCKTETVEGDKFVDGTPQNQLNMVCEGNKMNDPFETSSSE